MNPFVRKNLLRLFIAISVLEGIIILWRDIPLAPATPRIRSAPVAVASARLDAPSTFNFDGTQTITEAGDMEESGDPYWWLNSGGFLYTDNGTARTVSGELPFLSYWRILYAKTSSVDTDRGYHPQNLFRLVSRSDWQDLSMTAYFRIDRDNLSASPNRNATNGLLLMTRYQDGDNLYYAGIRVDGNAIIKKKIGGTYFTLAEKKIFAGTYDHDKNPSLLPIHEWVGLRSITKNNPDGTVTVTLLMDLKSDGEWKELASATDTGKELGGAPHREAGHIGIRTDFMDVSFRDVGIATP